MPEGAQDGAGVKLIDPVEFFNFMATYSDYPTNGYKLSGAAKRSGYSADLVHFLAGMPGQFANEAEVLPLAEEIDQPPRGQVLATGSELPDGSLAEAPTAQLTIDDITTGKP